MKTIACLLLVTLCGLTLGAADISPRKEKATAGTEQAKQSARAEAIANTLTPPQRKQLLFFFNLGDEPLLQRLPGIGAVRAAAIKKARPFADVTDVLKVPGIGEGTFASMVAHARAGFPENAKKPPARK